MTSPVGAERYKFFITDEGFVGFVVANSGKRRVFPKINGKCAEQLATDFSLSDVEKVTLLEGLNKCLIKSTIRKISNRSGDNALSNWMARKFGQGLRRLKTLHEDRSAQKQQAIREIAKRLDTYFEQELNAGNFSVEQIASEFGIETVALSDEPVLTHTEITISRWLRLTSLLDDITTRTRNELKNRDGAQSLMDGLTPEAFVYGIALPELYESVTGEPFESKYKDGELIQNEGHEFVIQAAVCLGFTRTSASNVHSHFSQQKQQA